METMIMNKFGLLGADAYGMKDKVQAGVLDEAVKRVSNLLEAYDTKKKGTGQNKSLSAHGKRAAIVGYSEQVLEQVGKELDLFAWRTEMEKARAALVIPPFTTGDGATVDALRRSEIRAGLRAIEDPLERETFIRLQLGRGDMELWAAIESAPKSFPLLSEAAHLELFEKLAELANPESTTRFHNLSTLVNGLQYNANVAGKYLEVGEIFQ